MALSSTTILRSLSHLTVKTLVYTTRMPPPSLLGPPEIYKSSPPSPAQEQQASNTVTDSFMDLMVANFNKSTSTPLPQMGFTENNSPTFLSSGNPCLDFFFHIVPYTPSESIKQRLQLAWNYDPLTTLKLICNLRGVRGTGKTDKEGFYTAAIWLHSFHPKTLACNIPSMARFGYMKDFPEILYRLLEGPDVRRMEKHDYMQRIQGRKNGRRRARFGFRKPIRSPFQRNKKKHKKAIPKEIRMEDEKRFAELVSIAREERREAMAKKAIERYINDPDYRFLFECISDFFAECLKIDMQHLNSGKSPRTISFAAKWCPSLNSSFDRSTLLCESIARKVFPRESYPEYEEIEEAHYAYRVRDRLRKEVLVPLRKVLELPEVYMSANRWDSLPYDRVASVAMKLYKDKFLIHDKERFNQYLADVRAGKAKIAAGALLPHEIIRSSIDDHDSGEVAELQWKRMVDDLLQRGKMKNCLAISDVSGSMIGTPLQVSVSLALLVSELSEEPWKGKLITFSANPTLHMVQGNSLRDKIKFVEEMEWDMNTDFQKVFDLILEVAVNGNLREDQMIKRLFVFSDMEFDQVSSNPWETDYQVIVRKFTDKGYGTAIPEIVFWNLRDSMSTPVTGTEKGVALVSGFSKNLMKLFLDGDGVVNPEVVMEMAISGREYQNLVVLD